MQEVNPPTNQTSPSSFSYSIWLVGPYMNSSLKNPYTVKHGFFTGFFSPYERDHEFFLSDTIAYIQKIYCLYFIWRIIAWCLNLLILHHTFRQYSRQSKVGIPRYTMIVLLWLWTSKNFVVTLSVVMWCVESLRQNYGCHSGQRDQ